jgi:hypothetical protein
VDRQMEGEKRGMTFPPLLLKFTCIHFLHVHRFDVYIEVPGVVRLVRLVRLVRMRRV